MRRVILATLLCWGCSPAQVETGAQVARDFLLPVAVKALRAEAAKRNVEIDENGAACFETPKVVLDIPELDDVETVALICIAPQIAPRE